MGAGRDNGDKVGTSPSSPSLREASPSEVGDVLALVTHDLRNPLAALSSNVGFLTMLEGELGTDALEAIDDLQLSIEAMGRIIDSLELVCTELRDVAPPTPLSLSVERLVKAVLPQAKRAAESHGVRLSVELGPYIRESVRVSEVPFLRALSALVHNALTVAPARSEVRLLVQGEQGKIVFRVEDDGPSLSSKLAEFALSAAGQAHVKTEMHGRYSRGLGLYGVARNAEFSGARLRQVVVDQGSVLEIVADQSS